MQTISIMGLDYRAESISAICFGYCQQPDTSLVECIVVRLANGKENRHVVRPGICEFQDMQAVVRWNVEVARG